MLQAKPRSLSQPVRNALIEDYLTDTARWRSVQQPLQEPPLELPRLNTDHVTHFGRSQLSVISAPSIGLQASTTGTPAHLEVYDRLMRDAQSQNAMVNIKSVSNPHRSLPALPSRPVRKKWGLSSAYTRAKSSQVLMTPDLATPRKLGMYEAPSPGGRTDVGMQCDGPDQPALYERYVAASRNPPSAVRSEPNWHDLGYLDGTPEEPVNVHKVLVKPYMCWGSGFRAPSKNESYEEELRRQESLTAVLHMPTRVSPRARSRRDAKAKAPPPTSRAETGRRYMNFCSAVPSRKTSPAKQKAHSSQHILAAPLGLLRTSPIQPYARWS